MKVVEALYEYNAEVIGLLKVTDDEVVFMNNWLLRREPTVRPWVSVFRVYTFETGKQEPMKLATMQWAVKYGDNLIGRVVA